MWLGPMSNYGRFPQSVTLGGVGSMGWLGNEGVDLSLVSFLVTVFVHRDQFQKKCSSTLRNDIWNSILGTRLSSLKESLGTAGPGYSKDG